LLVHGHLDVVPVDASEWSVHPFSGEIADGYLWGRGAVDMKDSVAMALALARQFKREGTVPPRDLIFAFLADEEAGGFFGAKWLVEHRPELFEGATEAISEVGGFSVTFPDGVRAYLIETAQKGIMWLRLKVRGTAGHGSMIHRDTANLTMFHAGYKANVIPSLAEASVDCRILPGREEAFQRELAEILGPEVERDWDSLPPVATTFDGALVDAMTAAIQAEDPGARLLPYMLSAGTDAKSFQQLGIRNFGFAPLRLPADLDFAGLFHGVNERVPLESLEFGVRVLDRFLRSC
jgi:acetylornithine deacetylase/succinyl-diaminopimelate desuccinylase-like protein